MPKYSKHQISGQAKSEAEKIANHIQRPGQTKEQTKLISQGIQKGIELYKKQQNAKARELDKKLKKAASAEPPPVQEEPVTGESGKSQWLPWSLLVLSWLGFAGVWYISST